MIKVVGTHFYFQLILFHHFLGVGEQEVRVGLKVYQTTIHQESSVSLHEVSGSKTFALVLHLGVAECEPYFLHLAICEEAINNLDICSEESHIRQSLFDSSLGTCPHACALDIYSYEVDIRKHSCHAYSIFSLSATKLKNYRIIVFEEFFTPFTFHFERHVVYN